MEQKLWPTKGILVHGLPRECQREALDIFAGLSLRYHSQDELGLRIFFEHLDCARKTILWQRVMVRETSYDIYPLVTNVTIHGIRRYAGKMEIKRLVEPYGPVVELYVVNNMLEEEHTRRRVVAMTDDYRVILDVPEVQAGYRLNPVVLPGVPLEFPISFFCRLCRQDGHKQFQCRAATSGNVAVPAPTTGRRESYDGRFPKVEHAVGNSPDQTDPRESSAGISSGWASSRHRDNSTPTSCSFGMRQKSDRRDPPSHQKDRAAVSSRSTVSQSHRRFTKYKNAGRESSERPRICHPPNHYLDYKNFPESTPKKSAPSASPIHSPTSFIHSIDSDPFQNQPHPRKIHRGASKEFRIPKKKDEISRPSKQERENAEKSKRAESLAQRDPARCKKSSTICKSREQPSNSAKEMDRLGCQSRRSPGLTEDAPSPPKCCSKMESKPVEDSEEDNARRTEGSSREGPTSCPARKRRRGIRMSLLAPPDTHPSRVMELIRVASSYDARNLPLDVEEALAALLDWNSGRSELNEKEASLVRHLEHFLAKVRSARAEEVATEGPVADAVPKEEGGDPSSSKKARRRRSSISQGVLGLLKEVEGELNPILLENYLKQVRGRRKAADMARHFTANVRGLICQLREVEKTYYVSGKRGGEEDVDIRFIRDLYLRLERDLSADDCRPHEKESESGKLVIKQEPA